MLKTITARTCLSGFGTFLIAIALMSPAVPARAVTTVSIHNPFTASLADKGWSDDYKNESSMSYSDTDEAAVTGLWLSTDERGIIHIYKRDGLFFGRLVWLKEPEDEQGNPILDEKNPDREKRTWPILGLEMVMGLEYVNGEWRNGEIYDPESGNTYSARLRLNGSNRMDLRGYIRLPMFGRTESWTRVEGLPTDGGVWPGFER